MESTICALLATGKGILAADESLPTIKKRFADIDIPSTDESRRSYREMLFTTHGLDEFISGVILFDETLRQATKDGTLMPEVLAKQGIVPGIKVDKGAVPLPHFAAEKITQGLDGLRERLKEYWELGARFTKWRAMMAISDRIPTQTCIEANAMKLAVFAALSQEAGLVPIVEPEVLMDGDHSIDRCEEVTTVTLKSVFDALFEHRVVLEQMLLKVGMVLSGKNSSQQAEVPEVAEATVRCLLRSVPAAVPGIVFLSGGQTDKAATQRLNAICGISGAPWKLSFSFGRALQNPALKIWNGSQDNVAAAQTALHHRAKCNGLAVEGKYSEELENAKP
jgi:fructose-bisphosphate aldolase class I